MTSRISVLFLACALLLSGVSVANANTFTVSQEIRSDDTTPPTTPTGVVAVGVASTQIDLSWTASTDNIEVAGYQIFRDGFAIASVTSPQVTFSDGGLIASTTYTYYLRAFDLDRNYSSSSATATASTLPEPVVTPTTTPATTTSPSTGSQLRLTPSSLNVTATPGIDRVALIIESPVPIRIRATWGTTYDADEGALVSSLYKRTHSTLVSGLRPETTYWIVIEATDAQGVVVTKTLQVTTEKDVRDTVPTNPSEFTGIVKEDGIHLTWKNPNDAAFSEVRIIRKVGEVATDPFDGVPVYEGGDQAFVDRNVAEGTIYGYTIFARTRDGAFSSGAVVVVRSFSEDTVGDARVVVIPKGETTETDWLLDGLTITQSGVEGKAYNKLFTITDDAPFTLSLASDGMPRVLKTILVTMRDPENFNSTFSFLLRLNDEGTAYEARIDSLKREGRFETMLALLNVETQSVESTAFTVESVKGTAGDTRVVAARSQEMFSTIYYGLLALALLIIAMLLWFAGRRHTYV